MIVFVKKLIPKKLYISLCKLYDAIRYLKNKPKYIKNINNYKIYSDEQTIDLIINEKKSISRYGDGEFKWILGKKQNSFQDDSVEMSNRLIEVLKNPLDNLLVGIPNSINDVSNYTFSAKIYWINFFAENFDEIKKYLDKNHNYCNASITRPYIDYKDKKGCKYKFENIKKLWNNKDVVIIEGNKTKMGFNNDLLSNAKSIQRIICPAKNAFEKYNEILECAKKIEKDKLILICLGPTATILAYDLAKEGYQALDTGHIDIEYEWYLNKSIKKESIVGKEVNEVKNNNKEKDLVLDEYEKTIIAIIE